MKRVIAGLIAVTAAALQVQLAASQDPIAQRQELMENTKDALKPMVGMSRGELAFDADIVMQSLKVMQQTAATAGELFPEGSEKGGDTEARSTIWSDREGFNEKLEDFGKAVDGAIAAAPQSLDDFQPVFMEVTKTCKGCHDGYRIDKD